MRYLLSLVVLVAMGSPAFACDFYDIEVGDMCLSTEPAVPGTDDPPAEGPADPVEPEATVYTFNYHRSGLRPSHRSGRTGNGSGNGPPNMHVQPDFIEPPADEPAEGI